MTSPKGEDSVNFHIHIQSTEHCGRSAANQENWKHSEEALSGAPNENIVQNHLNIALLNVF